MYKPPSDPPSQSDYAPPPGPPPGYGSHAPPSGLATSQDEYAPPPGPPPSQYMYGAPPGPPPGDEHVPNEDWKLIPDTALLPPPPSMGHDYGVKSNAESNEADRAHEWCRANAMIRPHQPSQATWKAVQGGDVRVVKPPEYRGDLMMPNVGTWRGSTRAGAPDSCLISSAPLYFALADAPTRNGRVKKTIYYEIEIKSLGRGHRNEESSIAIGYCAIPYPTWRMPGWERGSLAVHSDDGRRYVNDTWGGKDFTTPIQAGDTIGLGVTFTIPTNPPGYDSAPVIMASGLQAEVFFTRNGREDSGWNLHEELDEADRGVDGLDGAYDLFAAVGVYGGAEFDIKFKRDGWLWFPR